ncbi:39S ribosomal protein L32, mitochondrial-like [Daphnia pulicaria]|uniref:39S ribosomal protein L32, mitochondrial-like n=1 Tax=Daphnia pulicaria TaxID=35523 RepID=UPI001EEB98DC|nr:39S ribosomal protein L32, mitochondrial-like [Daphnia pulicaria]XP_046635368.1 39S ribosomal protein L32, mitochondrial-like [Daphnia pulicaria]
MAGQILKRWADALVHFEYVYLNAFLRQPHTPQWIPLLVQPTQELVHKNESFNINSIFDGFLWGVPTCRRSAEKRMMRKYGSPQWHNKLILPRKDIKVCGTCGHYHEEKCLCPNCYSKVKAETTILQEQMIKELGINPVEKEVAIVYQGEKNQFNDEFFKDNKVIEVEKPRPKWFSKNLLQKSNANVTIETSTIKPHDLG